MVIYKKCFRRYATYPEAERPSKQNIVIAHTILAEARF